MHKTQQLIILLGVLLVCLMGAYPPWEYVDADNAPHPMGYAPIWNPPTEHRRDTAELFGIKLQMDMQKQTANTVDLFKLLMQIVALSVITGGAVVLLKTASGSPTQKGTSS